MYGWCTYIQVIYALKKLVSYWSHGLYCLQVTFFHWRIYWEKKILVGSMIYQSKSPPPNTKQLGRKTKALENFWHKILSYGLFTNFMCSPWREMCVNQQNPQCHEYSVLNTIRVMLGFREFLWRLHRAAKNIFKNVISPT